MGSSVIMDIESIKPFLAVVISLLGAVFIIAARRSPNVREGCSLVAAILKFLIVLTMVPAIMAGKTLHYTLLDILEGVSIGFRVDAFGLLFALIASFLWILNTLYSIGYMRSLNAPHQTRYYLCFAITLSATMGVAFSANLLTLWLFYEIISFFTYPLVAHNETEEAYAAGNKYIFYLLMLSKLFLLASILTYALSGTFDFKPNGIFPPAADRTVVILTYFLFLAGIGKAAIMPLHAWLPAAMVAPTPVSALLHAVAVVNTGVFCILRIIFHIFGVELMKALNLGVVTAFIASFTIIMASIYALIQDDLKLRLAYSTVSQLSYIILGGALLTSSGMAGGIMHIVNHSFAKITLFFCAGSIYVASHKTKVSELSGIGRQMPWTMAAFSIGALSMIGIVPPVAGFVTKSYLLAGSMEAGWQLIFYVLWASALLNIGYFLPIIYKAFFQAPSQQAETPVQEPSYLLLLPLLLCGLLTVILGIYPGVLMELIRHAV